ncbi:hypothetical protein ABKV19_006675 [Rosa sericea]
MADKAKLYYRLHVVIEDPNSEATVKLRGKAAEQLFGTTCKELISKYPYAMQDTLPEEILQTKGQIHIFQIQINDANEFIIKGIFPDMESLLEQIEHQPTTSTPAHSLPEKKRFPEKSRRELFGTNTEKKTRREGSIEPAASSMETFNKEKTD